MADDDRNSGIGFGIYGRRGEGDRGRLSAAVVIAAVLSVLWLVATGGFFLATEAPAEGTGRLAGVMVLMAIVLPIALVWVAALAVRAAHGWRQDAARLQAAVDALRQAYVMQSQGGGRPSVDKKLDAIAEAQKNTETVLATFVSRREPGAAPPGRRPPASARLTPVGIDPQQSLALGTPAEDLREPLSAEEFIRALNFPDDAQDREGFRVLRRALEDREASKLVRASQDVLTLLSHEGIYMDDLRPDRARPEIWRRFAQGERGRTVAALGGVRDRSSLALTAARMRQDVIFRDAAHHFLRNFDRTVSAFVEHASDQDIAELAETRTARAFMLLGRVTGTFD